MRSFRLSNRVKHVAFIAALALIATALTDFADAANLSDGAAEISKAGRLCSADGGRLWGVSLCGPLMLVDPETREFITDRDGTETPLKRQDGFFRGVLPSEVTIANTAVHWNGVDWIMVIAPLPRDPNDRGTLLMHESWHHVQSRLGLPANSAVADHLAQEQGRIAFRLELRALSAALQAKSDRARRLAIKDALLFRAWRRREFPTAAASEQPMEMSEGLAEYTGRRLSGDQTPELHVAQALVGAEHQESFVRTYAYSTGPAYGLLLDRTNPQWRKGLTPAVDLGALLGNALRLKPTISISTQDLRATKARYGARDVEREESGRAKEHARQEAAWRAKLISGPVMAIALTEPHVGFDPRNLFPLGSDGTVYPTLSVADQWGDLKVDGGALMAPDWSRLSLPGPATQAGEVLGGPGWTLKLAQGWRLAPGARSGDMKLEPVPR